MPRAEMFGQVLAQFVLDRPVPNVTGLDGDAQRAEGRW
jgi:hypothetical protein